MSLCRHVRARRLGLRVSGYKGAEKQAPVPPAPTHPPLCSLSPPPAQAREEIKGSPLPCCFVSCLYAAAWPE
eukprot:5945167-Pyramimonas_sp.AAC.1